MKFSSVPVFIFFSCIFSSVVAIEFRFDYAFSKEADGWLKFHEVPAIFKEALLRCKAEGAKLASPLNEGLRNAMMALFKSKSSHCGILTGIHATFSRGDFLSIEGIPLTKIPVAWAPGEPDNFNNHENCTMMLPNGTLADVPCGDTFPYICYRKKANTPVITTCGIADKDYTFEARTGSCYKFHNIGANWRRAHMTCVAEGGHLVVINNEVEAQVIREIFAKVPDGNIIAKSKEIAAAGYYAPAENTYWLTVEGDTLAEAGYSTFHPEQPSNPQIDGGEYCGAVYRSAQLDDVWCNSIIMPFICEKKPESLLNDIYV